MLGIKFQMVWLVALLILAPTINPALSQTSVEYTRKGALLYAAFECSILALKSEYGEEAVRHFDRGYAEGTEFITALSEGKIEEQDIRENVPVGVSFYLEGPSVDFILGRVYENIRDNTVSNTLRDAPDPMNPKGIYRDRYRERNCALLGK